MAAVNQQSFLPEENSENKNNEIYLFLTLVLKNSIGMSIHNERLGLLQFISHSHLVF